MNRPPWLIGSVLALLFCAIVTAWFFRNFERVVEEREVGFQGEARRNPLLALERLLTAQGVAAEGRIHLTELPAPPATVLLAASGQSPYLARAGELRSWMARGGHLVLVPLPRSGEGEADTLLKPFGIQARYDRKAPRDPEPAIVKLREARTPLKVQFLPRAMLAYGGSRAPIAIAGSGRQHLVQIAVGIGRLTVLSDDSFLRNGSIGQHDHAAAGLALLSGNGPVWLVREQLGTSLAALIWRHAREAVIAFAVLVVLALWAAAARFGPLLPAEDLRRRRLLDHITGSGRFLWRSGRAAALIDSSREALMRTVLYRHPDWLKAADLQERLAQAAKLPPEDVRRALEARATASEAEFTATIRTLETLRKSL
ncbi:MAG: DUF4350 domain-containing protein [Pseudomonadota bacterium]